MTRFDMGRRLFLAGAATLALGGCMRLDHRKALRTLVFRVPAVSRPVLWETLQRYASQNHLACHLLRELPDKARNFMFVARGQGLDIVGRNNAYDPLQPDDYEIRFYAETVFGASQATIDRFADALRDTLVSENSVRLISDSATPPK